MRNHPLNIMRTQRGLTLIELMVGMVVALLVALAASGSAQFFTAAQRQGMGTSGTATNSANALSALKYDLGQVGLGFFGNSRSLCDHLNFSIGAADRSTNNFSPLQVQRGNFDQLDAIYADRVAGGANVRIESVGANSVSVRSFLPVTAGDAVLLAPAPGTVGPRCTVRTATDVAASAAPNAVQDFTFDAAGAHNQVGFAAPVAYGTDDMVLLLGGITWNRYFVDADQNLTVTNMLTNRNAVLVRNVVGFRVQYGTTPAGSTTVTNWQDPTGAWAALSPANLPQVRAINVGVVARSTQPEKRDGNGNCVATTAVPQLFGTNVAAAALPADWQCFRYRTSIVTVPMRNIAIGLQ